MSGTFTSSILPISITLFFQTLLQRFSDFVITKQPLFRAKTILLLLLNVLLLSSVSLQAQTPGLIYKPATGAGKAVLDPNGDGYTSASTSGFSGTDYGTASELNMVAIPQLSAEPSGDLATGSTGGHTDMVDAGSNRKAVFVMSTGTNLIIRFRIGNASTASKGYSILIDTDNAFSGTGTNLGFEQEIVLETGTNGRIAVYNHTSGSSTLVASYNVDDHQQRSVALTTNDGNADYFYDYYVPLSVLSGNPLRFAAATITSAGSGITGTISDVSGVNDLLYNGNIPAILTATITSFPATTLSSLTAGATFAAVQTGAPFISSSLLTTSTSVSGTSAEPTGTSITVYKNGASMGNATVNSNAWTLSGISSGTFTGGDIVTAKAQDNSGGKTLSAASNSVVVGQICTTAPIITAETNGAKGYEGTWTALPGQSIAANSVRIFIHGISAETTTINGQNFVTGQAFTITTNASGAAVYVVANATLGATSTFTFPLFTTGNSVPQGTYWATAENIGSGNCVSNSSNLFFRTISATTAPVITPTSISNSDTQVSGTKVTNSKIYLYVNGGERQVLPATASTSWTATGLTLVAGDKITAKALVDAPSPSGLSEASNEVTVVSAISGTSAAPLISGTYNDTKTSVTGTSAEAAGTIITVYKNGLSAGTTTVTIFGTWTLPAITMATNDVLTAKATASGKNQSLASPSVTVLGPTTNIPAVNSPILANSSSVGGTQGSGTLKVYIDGEPLSPSLNSQVGAWSYSSAQLASLTAELYAGASVTATNTESGKLESAKSAGVTVVGVNNFRIEKEAGGDIATQIAGIAFPVKITARDGANATFTTYTGTNMLSSGSTISAGSGPTSAFVSGILASHSITLTKAGSYTLTTLGVNDPGVTGTSNTFLINPAAPNRLQVFQEPSSTATSAVSFPVQPKIYVYDQFGNHVTTDNTTQVLVSIASGTGGTLNGVTTVTAVNGIITFAGLNIQGSGGYTLSFTSSGLTPATSGTITVTGAAPAAPSGLTYESPKTFPSGQAITFLSPTVTGSVTSYSVLPALPAGLTLDSGTGVISGTPTSAKALTVYTLTATNGTGSTTFDLTITVTGGSAPTATAVTIAGTQTVGQTLTGSFTYADADGDLQGTSTYRWLSSTTSGGIYTAISGATSTTYVLVAADQGKFIKFEATPVAATGNPSTGTAVESAATSAISGRAPTAAVTIAGTQTVGQTLTGSFTYADADSDLQGTSTYRWLSSTTSGGIYTPISGATSTTYVLVAADQGKFIKFEATPVAATGNPSTGTAVESAATSAIAGRAPTATAVTIAGTQTVGQTLTGSFTYADADNDAQGTSTYRWLSSTTSGGLYSAITGATSNTYLLVAADQGKFIKFEATPVAATGNPSTGTASESAATSIIKNPVPVIAFASPLVFIKGTAISPVLPLSTGGPVSTYTNTGTTLPSGLTLNPTTGVISGTPSAVTDQKTYTITAQNDSGSSISQMAITVNDIAPLITYTSPVTLKKGISIPPMVPSNTGGPVLSFSVSPALPAGLVLNLTSGAITGTPTVVSSQTNYIVKATNSGGSSSFTLDITIFDMVPVISYKLPASFVIGIPVNVVPSISGGSPASYAVDKALPSGLNLDVKSGVISGTPTELKEEAVYTITFTNSGGTNTFTIPVAVKRAEPKLEVILTASNPVKQQDGSFNVDYRVKVSNIGNTPLSNLELTVDLNKVFPAPVQFTLIKSPTASGTRNVIPNNSFNGVGNINLLSRLWKSGKNDTEGLNNPRVYIASNLKEGDLSFLQPDKNSNNYIPLLAETGAGEAFNLILTNSGLEISDTSSVTFSLNIKPNGNFGPYPMNVIGTGQSSSGDVVQEMSTDGRLLANTEITGTKYPTIVSIFPNPLLGSSLNIQEVQRLSDNSFDVKLRAKIKNAGNLVLSEVKLLADLQNQFKKPSAFSIKSLILNTNNGLIRNSLFDGAGNNNLLLPKSAINVGVENIVDFIINIQPNGIYGDYSLQLAAEGFAAENNQLVSNTSFNGLDPDKSLTSKNDNKPTIFNLVAPGPQNLILSNSSVYENNAADVVVGTFAASDVSNSPLNYTLAAGSGDTDNSRFKISGAELLASQSFDFEMQATYSIRARVTNQSGLFFDKSFVISVKDINEAPTLDVIAEQRIFVSSSHQVIPLRNIGPGPESQQQFSASVSADNMPLFEYLSIKGNELRYKLNDGVLGSANIKVTIKDDGQALNGGVDQISRDFKLTVDPMPTITASPSAVSKGFISSLQVSSQVQNTYVWTSAQGLSASGIPNPIVRPDQTTTYYVQVTNKFGNSVTLSTTVEVKEDYKLTFPNVFSPNGDGLNDKWVIENISSYPDHTLTFLDRSGRVLQKVRKYDNDWDGTVNGLPLEIGTYYFIIQFDKGSHLMKKGFITIVR